jgi:hypothetical protein
VKTFCRVKNVEKERSTMWLNGEGKISMRCALPTRQHQICQFLRSDRDEKQRQASLLASVMPLEEWHKSGERILCSASNTSNASRNYSERTSPDERRIY